MDENELLALLAETRATGSDMTFGMHYAVMVPLSLLVTKGLVTIEEAILRAEQFEKMIKEGPRPRAAVPLEILISTLRQEQDRRESERGRPSHTWEPRIVEGGRKPEDSDGTPT